MLARWMGLDDDSDAEEAWELILRMLEDALLLGRKELKRLLLNLEGEVTRAIMRLR